MPISRGIVGVDACATSDAKFSRGQSLKLAQNRKTGNRGSAVLDAGRLAGREGAARYRSMDGRPQDVLYFHLLSSTDLR